MSGIRLRDTGVLFVFARGISLNLLISMVILTGFVAIFNPSALPILLLTAVPLAIALSVVFLCMGLLCDVTYTSLG